MIYELELTSPLSSDKGHKEWKALETSQFNIELPRDTLVLAEKCIEYRGEVDWIVLNFLVKIYWFFSIE